MPGWHSALIYTWPSVEILASNGYNNLIVKTFFSGRECLNGE
jgi:hypothetical protein